MLNDSIIFVYCSCTDMAERVDEVDDMEEAFKMLKLRDKAFDDFVEELQKGFSDKKTLGSVLSAANELITRMNQDDSSVFDTFANAIDLISTISSTLPVFSQYTKTFSVLSGIIKNVGFALKSNTKSQEEDTLYSELKRYQDSELLSEAVGLEDALFSIHAYMTCLSEETNMCVINSLEDKIYVNETVRFLGKLKGKTREILMNVDVLSAYRAKTYVNLFFRIAILRTLVLWQIFCIKKQSGADPTSTEGVLAIITETKKTDLEMLGYVTETHIDKAVFLTVFHPTENENFLHFLQMHSYRIPSIGQEKSFYSKKHAICLSLKPAVKFKVSSMFDGRVLGTSEAPSASEFIFEPVDDRMIDNIFFLHSKRSNKMYYIYMHKNGSCYCVKDKPKAEGQWKVVRLENKTGPPQFVLSTLMWPCRFLSLDPLLGILFIKSTYDMEKVRTNGLWDIIDL